MYEEESLMDYFDTDEEIALEENEEAADFDEVNKESLEDKTAAELQKMKIWLFSENVRIAAERKRLKDMEEQIIKDRQAFQEEMQALNRTILSSQKRLKQDEMFFEKKMQILENGFAELESDRKKLEREKEMFRLEQKNAEMRSMESRNVYNGLDVLFAGVNNPLALKKRYRDLIKIYHPDNIAGDKGVVLYINQEYERLSREI
ncbi:MAG: hypothetical protein IJ589_05300 [Lachnospiraceae bacterium]|jgi:hypothetical protein|nr:hypothetical protein [Lachnospiraceae bacterium]